MLFFSYHKVEDPSEEFVRLRDFVDAQNSKNLESFSKENLKKGFSSVMVEEAQRELKINKVCRSILTPKSYLVWYV